MPTLNEALAEIKRLAETGEGQGFAQLVLHADGSASVRTDVTLEEFMAQGRVADCDCQLLQCVCALARQHKKDCRFRKALTCAVPIECDPHGVDVCPVCDPCTCGVST